MNKLMIVIAVLALGGCVRESLRADHGYSVENNMTVQALNPNAPDKELSGMDGQKAESAYQNYLSEDGKVKDETLIKNIRK